MTLESPTPTLPVPEQTRVAEKDGSRTQPTERVLGN